MWYSLSQNSDLGHVPMPNTAPAAVTLADRTVTTRRGSRLLPSPASRVDLAIRLRQFERTVAAHSQRADWFAEVFRGAHESLDSRRVAEHVAARMAGWMPLASWSLYALDAGTRVPVLLAASQHIDGVQDSLAALAAESMRESQDVFVPNLRARDRKAPARAALAWALHARGRTVGALVGLDAARSTALPAEAQWRETASLLLDPIALALDNALRLERAERLAVTDDLTQLYNSRFLADALKREVKRADRGRRRLSLLFLDLDEFKRVNDTWGHLVGSRALVEFGRVIRRSVRETDVVARFGGDEFAVILPDTPRLGAVAVADRIRERVRRRRFSVDDHEFLRLAVSIGVSSLSPSITTAEALLHAADKAMYEAKGEGGNRICVAKPPRGAGRATRTRTARTRAGEETRR